MQLVSFPWTLPCAGRLCYIECFCWIVDLAEALQHAEVVLQFADKLPWALIRFRGRRLANAPKLSGYPSTWALLG